MTPFALAIRDEGFDNPKIMQKASDNDILPGLQSHTVDLKLLEKAHVKQGQFAANCTALPDDVVDIPSSPLGSPVAMSNVLTPPRSISKNHK